jgi:hypothetical protein
MLLCFEKQGGASMIDPETYLYYIQVKPSEPSRDRWIRYDAEAERVILGDFRRLWATNFLEDLVVDVQDYPLANGVVGKVIVFSMEERQRVKIVDYEGSHAVSQSDIDSRLKDKAVTIRLDSFLDPAIIRRVSSLVRELYAEKGSRGEQMAAMKQWSVLLAFGMATVWAGACQSPTTSDDALDIDDILVVTAPGTATADVSPDAKTYRVVRGNNQPDDILAYDWKATFSVSLQFNDAADDKDALTFPVDLTAVTVKVQQASGGIVTAPTGGDVEHYEFVTQASSNAFAAVGSNVGITFDVWYDLPSLRKEALVTLTLSFVDDDGTIFTKTVDMKIAP